MITEEQQQEQYSELQLDLAIAIRQYGAKKILVDFLTAYPGEYMQLSAVLRNKPIPKVPRLMQEWDND